MLSSKRFLVSILLSIVQLATVHAEINKWSRTGPIGGTISISTIAVRRIRARSFSTRRPAPWSLPRAAMTTTVTITIGTERRDVGSTRRYSAPGVFAPGAFFYSGVLLWAPGQQ